MAKRERQIKLEPDVIRAISGAGDEEAARTIEKVQQAEAGLPKIEIGFLPARTVVNKNGEAVVVDLEGRDAQGNFVEEATEEEISAIEDEPTLFAGEQRTFVEQAGRGGVDAKEKVTPKQSWTATDGTVFYDETSYKEYQNFLEGNRRERQSAYDLLYEQFSAYGLGSLVEPLRGLISDPTVSSSEFTIRLRGTDAYKNRFSANQARIGKGLRALSEAEYLELEDSYQDVMRRYGLPETYYTKGELGKQEGFEQLLGFDVSPRELEERISAAQDRVKNAPPEVMTTLREFYGDTIKDGDILAYVLDPKNAMDLIKRRVTAAEIGAGAAQAGLLGKTPQERAAYATRAEELAKFGVTGEQARAGFQTVAAVQPRGSQLAAIYGEAPLTQTEVESEVFGTTGAVEARKKRERLVGREQAAFSGSSGTTQGALARERAGQL